MCACLDSWKLCERIAKGLGKETVTKFSVRADL